MDMARQLVGPLFCYAICITFAKRHTMKGNECLTKLPDQAVEIFNIELGKMTDEMRDFVLKGKDWSDVDAFIHGSIPWPPEHVLYLMSLLNQYN